MRIDFAGFVPMVGRDRYLHGRGAMRGKLLGIGPVVDGSGPEFDVGELSTYLNDAVLMAPSMLLGPAVTWGEVDDRTFDVSLTNEGRSVTGRVYLDERGAPQDFSTTDRYVALPGGPVQAEWTTPKSGWRTVGGRSLPVGGSAVWHLPDSAFTYAELAFGPGAVEYNVAPSIVR